MRFPGHFFSLLAAGKPRGVIMERGDGELVAYPTLQPGARVPAPIALNIPGGINQRSFTETLALFTAGAAGAQLLNGSGHERGLWRFNWNFHSSFSGVVTAVNGAVELQDAATPFAPRGVLLWFSPLGLVNLTNGCYIHSLLDFRFQVQVPAQAVGDNSFVSFSYQSERLL